MKYIVVEKKEGTGWVEHLECSLETDAQKIVAELYREAQKRGENREFKVIELPGEIVLPVDKPRKSMSERIDEKLSKILKV